MQKDCDGLMMSCYLRKLGILIPSCLWFSSVVIQFQFLPHCLHHLCRKKKHKCVSKLNHSLHGPDGVVTTARNEAPEVDEAIRLLLY